MGVVGGVVMLGGGMLTMLVWHAKVDASLVGLLLVRSSSLYFRVSGIVIGLAVLIPFGVAVYSRARRGTFEEHADLLNGTAEPERSSESPETVLAPELPVGHAAIPATAPTQNYARLSR